MIRGSEMDDSHNKMGLKRVLYGLLCVVFSFIFIAPSVSAQSLSQDDQSSIYSDTVWYKASGSSAGGSGFTGCTVGGASGGNITLDQFLQALAYHESGGDPTTGRPSGSDASGKYQYLASTWQSSATAYYPPALQYPTARDAPESYQDAVAYIEYTVKSIKFSGNVAEMAVSHIYPEVATNPSVWPTYKIGSNPTAQQYADDVVGLIQNGTAGNIPMEEKQAPQFNQFLVRAGTPAQLSISGGASCSCSQAIISTAKSFAWPTYHPPVYLTKTTGYEAAVTAALSRGEYVGPTDEPYLGVDCGAFITRIMRDSNADPTYNSENCNTVCQKDYMDQNSQKYQNLGVKTSTDGLQPGDIAINDVHTFMYLGNEGFPGYDSVSASFSSTGESWRAPMAS